MSVNPVTGTVVAQTFPAYQAGAEDAPVAVSAQPAASPSLFYISPVITLDDSGLAVLQWRDSNTGEVKVQIPPENVVERYRIHGTEPRVATLPGGGEKGGAEPEGTTEPGGDQPSVENNGPETGQNVALSA